MSVTLDIKLPDGEQAPVHAYHTDTLVAAMMIIEKDTGDPNGWARLIRPHVTSRNYEWTIHFRNESIKVELPAGSSINIYR